MRVVFCITAKLTADVAVGSKPEFLANAYMSAFASSGHTGGDAFSGYVPLADRTSLFNHAIGEQLQRVWHGKT
jgi:hypothetical protein